ncbi:cyanoexosortase A system-associated protein [Pseudanabaena yagii]|uniref:Cyanoexosortase A system-associated protein n=1 Tax=Pseudanabaena yagii GIHE-NHR1 TaxID=2722753 RepID=A0ABX1LWI5_9CYAN|nr:cyanoexosortase A system-associated protein [Pseudanabaena yagii]NMF59370.1 cyanoexosortase A system-associated protein [Pseudanabaena yagii GIHE-NHR1]
MENAEDQSDSQKVNPIDAVNPEQPKITSVDDTIHKMNEVEQADGIKPVDKPKDSINDVTNYQPNYNYKNQKLRFGLLAILVAGSLLIFLRSLVDGNIGKPTPAMFPERLELTEAKLTQSEPLIDTKDFYFKPKYLSGHRYKFLVDNQPIDIALRYGVGTEGDIPIFLKELANIDMNEDEIRQKIVRKDPIGYYAMFTYQNQAYLTACINPRGISTVTKEQFDDNASDRAMDRDVIISWLLGQKDLRDRRCLWTLMSTPLTADKDRAATNQKLEKIWISWYEWWKTNFPQP